MDPATSQPVLKFGPYLVDLQAGELRKFGSRVRLQEKPLQLLAALAERSGQVVTREELHRRLWPDHTFVDFETGLNTAVSKLRDALSDSTEKPRYIETIPRRGYRFLFPVELGNGHSRAGADVKPNLALQVVATTVVELESAGSAEAMARTTGRNRSTSTTGLWSLLGTILLLSLLAGGYLYSHRVPKLTDKDTIVVADFANSTGDPIFDDTLKTALTVSLRQSPFLNVLPESEAASVLQQMTRPADTKITPEIASELCQRSSSKAYIAGSIGSLGSEYVVGIKAFNCRSRDILGEEQVTASSKEKVLDTLGAAISKLRAELGESLATMQRFDVPLAQATTASLEALKSYSLADRAFQGDTAAGLPYFERAIELDPNFAMAYRAVGGVYLTLGEPERAKPYLIKAFQLREHSSEPEKLLMIANYYSYVTGELDKAVQTYEEVVESYPSSGGAYEDWAATLWAQGKYSRAAEITKRAMRRNPNNKDFYENLAAFLLASQRVDEARQVLHAMPKTDDYLQHQSLYALAFLGMDAAAMSEQQQWFAHQPEYEHFGLALASDSEASAGHEGLARELTNRSVGSAIRSDSNEDAAMWRANAALQQAAYGYAGEARRSAAKALKLAPASEAAEAEAALAFAMVGDVARAESLAQALEKRLPLNTQMQSLWLPAIRAQLALNRNNSAAAVEGLQAASPIELGGNSFGNNVSCLYHIYIRGEAYLAAGDSNASAAEFQKVLDHSGIVWNCWTGALARLGVARANALESRTLYGADAESARTRALASYQGFLTLWKDADPDIPILNQAKAEYAKMLNVRESSK
jgi:DNA-binding winged helix-turn-helix (wHTH) protein/tetratricopeptide (TPR) repeat protein